MLKKSRFPRLASVQVQVRFEWVCVCVWCDFCLPTCVRYEDFRGGFVVLVFHSLAVLFFVLFLVSKRSQSDGLRIPFSPRWHRSTSGHAFAVLGMCA